MNRRVEPMYRGTVVDVFREEVELPNGSVCELEVVDHPGGAAVVAVDADGRVCLLRQYRYVAGGWLWELPAGKRDGGEAPRLTAERELLEEAGCEAGSWTSLGEMHSSPGVFKEVVYLYAAHELRIGRPDHEEHEVFELHWVPFAEALEWARTSKITDAKSVIGLFRASALFP